MKSANEIYQMVEKLAFHHKCNRCAVDALKWVLGDEPDDYLTEVEEKYELIEMGDGEKYTVRVFKDAEDIDKLPISLWAKCGVLDFKAKVYRWDDDCYAYSIADDDAIVYNMKSSDVPWFSEKELQAEFEELKDKYKLHERHKNI